MSQLSALLNLRKIENLEIQNLKMSPEILSKYSRSLNDRDVQLSSLAA